MTPYEKQRAKERELAAIQKQKLKQRNTRIAWLVIIGIVLVIFALGTLFGYHLTSHTPPQTTNADVEAASPTQQRTTTPKVIEVSSTATEKEIKPIGVPGVSLDYDLQKAMYEYCQKYEVPFALALAVAEKESNFNPDAVSKTDDHGIMQINRCNFEYLRNKGIDPLTYEGNIEAGIMLLGENLTLYSDEELAVMAYNCGRTGAKRLWDAGTYSTAYSRAVMELYEKWLGILEDQ